MIVEKLIIKNYKMFKDETIKFNEHMNIIVGDNDAGKSTILEALYLVLTGKINNSSLQSVLNLGMFNYETRFNFIDKVRKGETLTELPSIEIEAFLKLGEEENQYKNFKGTNNSLREDSYGIKVEIVFDEQNTNTFKGLLQDNKINDIPLELYKVVYRSFASGDSFISRVSKSAILIDTTHRDYSKVLNRFISSNFINCLSDQDKANLRVAYKGNKESFLNNQAVVSLNERIKEKVHFKDYSLSINLRDAEVDAWRDDVEVKMNDVSVSSMGFGTQNMFKTQLVTEENEDINILLMEEPENSLTFANMSMLVSYISGSKFKQVFIATHSSYVANRLGLDNLLLVVRGKVNYFTELGEEKHKDALNYFKVLPGYNTLRLLLAEKTILVEGPADELIIQKAFLDNHGKLPIECGIDVLSVGGIAFKSYCHLAKVLKKRITIVTDNDGECEKKKGYFEEFGDVVKLCIEADNELNTLEPSVLNANKDDFNSFKEIVYKRGDPEGKIGYKELLDFMTNNKTKWALRIFESEKRIKFPKYINEAISDE